MPDSPNQWSATTATSISIRISQIIELAMCSAAADRQTISLLSATKPGVTSEGVFNNYGITSFQQQIQRIGLIFFISTMTQMTYPYQVTE